MSKMDPVPDHELEQANLTDITLGDSEESIRGRERADTLLVNRQDAPEDWGTPENWPTEREVVDIGRKQYGERVMTNTEPEKPGWLGNPYRLNDGYSREESVRRYRGVFYRLADENSEFREAVLDVQGSILLGWCVPDLCHGDVILEWLDAHASG